MGISQRTLRLWIQTSFIKAERESLRWIVSKDEVDRICQLLQRRLDVVAMKKNIAPAVLREYIRRKIIKAEKINGRWYISEEERGFL